MHVLRAAALGSCLLALSASMASAQVDLSIQNGRVTLVATNATVRQVLAEWARVGQTKIVNLERIPGGPLTLQLTDVSEEEALDILLRSVSGYMAAPRSDVVANLSRFDRILVMPTIAAPRTQTAAATPSPVFQQAPIVPPEADDQTEPAGGAAPSVVAPARAPMFQTFTPPQIVAPQPAATNAGQAAPAASEQQASPGAAPAVVGVPRPGMIDPAARAAWPDATAGAGRARTTARRQLTPSIDGVHRRDQRCDRRKHAQAGRAAPWHAPHAEGRAHEPRDRTRPCARRRPSRDRWCARSSSSAGTRSSSSPRAAGRIWPTRNPPRSRARSLSAAFRGSGRGRARGDRRHRRDRRDISQGHGSRDEGGRWRNSPGRASTAKRSTSSCARSWPEPEPAFRVGQSRHSPPSDSSGTRLARSAGLTGAATLASRVLGSRARSGAGGALRRGQRDGRVHRRVPHSQPGARSLRRRRDERRVRAGVHARSSTLHGKAAAGVSATTC